MVEYQFPKLQTEVRALVGPQRNQNNHQQIAGGCFDLASDLRHVRRLRNAASLRAMSRGREHLVDYEWNEIIYLVICDRQSFQLMARAARAGGTGIFLLFLE